MNSKNKVNEKVYNLYAVKTEELNRLKNHLLIDVGFESEDKLDLALKIFRTRYDLVAKYNATADQAIHTSNICLKAVFGDVINWNVIALLEECDRLTCHVKALKELIHDKSAVLISDYETIGEDNFAVVGIGHVINSGTIEFYSLSNDYIDKFDSYIDSDWEPDCEQQKRCMKYWRDCGML